MTENLDAFLFDFAVDCVKPDGSVVKVILDAPDLEVLTSMVIDGGDHVIGKTTDLISLNELDAVTIDGRPYRVRKVLKIHDGAFSDVTVEAL